MAEKVVIFVPPYKMSTHKKHESKPIDATLIRQLIAEAKEKGYEIIEMNHPKELWKVRALKPRKEFLVRELAKYNLKGKEVVVIGHSLGAFLVKHSLKELSELVGGPFKAISIAGRHSGGMKVDRREILHRELQTGWEVEHQAFYELSQNPKLPKGCKLIEVFSPGDPILRGASKAKVGKAVPIHLKKVDPKIEAFITHHLFKGHEKRAAKAIMRHI